MKKIINITVWIVIIAGLLVLVSFIEAEHKKITCKSLDVSIDYKDGDPMITSEEIKKQVFLTFDTLIGKKYSKINSANIENLINEMDLVENAEVYTTLTGKMKIQVVQRKPILRIINSSNQNYYLDNAGIIMPVSPGYPSRVLVANGFINQKYSDTLTFNNNDEKSILAKLYKLSSYINNHEFLNAQIEQIYVTKNKEFELVPKVGRQIIILVILKIWRINLIN